MKFSNLRITGSTEKYVFGTVAVTTGILWWKKTQDRGVFQPRSFHWRWGDNGRMITDDALDNLFIAWKAQRELLMSKTMPKSEPQVQSQPQGAPS
jgi:hypothetical protein